jgi:hypothetical protein
MRAVEECTLSVYPHDIGCKDSTTCSPAQTRVDQWIRANEQREDRTHTGRTDQGSSRVLTLVGLRRSTPSSMRVVQRTDRGTGHPVAA